MLNQHLKYSQVPAWLEFETRIKWNLIEIFQSTRFDGFYFCYRFTIMQSSVLVNIFWHQGNMTVLLKTLYVFAAVAITTVSHCKENSHSSIGNGWC